MIVEIGRCLTALSPSRNRACQLPGTRLLGFITGFRSPLAQVGCPSSGGFRLRGNPYLTCGHRSRVLPGLLVKLPAPRQPAFTEGLRHYPPGYGFPLPFGRRLSLFGASSARCGVRPPLRLADWRSPTRPHRGCHVPHRRDARRVGALFTPESWCPSPLVETLGPGSKMDNDTLPVIQYGRLDHHRPTTRANGASSRVHLHSPVSACPSPVSRR